MRIDGGRSGVPVARADTVTILGLPGFGVAGVVGFGDELVLVVQTVAAVAGCWCGVVARLHDRRPVLVGDLPVGGRPVRRCWSKRVAVSDGAPRRVSVRAADLDRDSRGDPGRPAAHRAGQGRGHRSGRPGRAHGRRRRR